VGTIIGTVGNANDYNGRNQINVKIDHNINSKNRVSANWTYERTAGSAFAVGMGHRIGWRNPPEAPVYRR